MDQQDDSLPLPEVDGIPFIPDPYSITISDEEARRLQEILNHGGGEQFSLADAKYRGLEILRLFLHLLDPAGYAYHLKHPQRPPTARMPEDLPDTPPIPQPAPINLAADHKLEIDQALAMLADELRHVTRRPSHWRWCLAAMYRALGHALALRRPASFRSGLGLGELTRLFDAVAGTMPELPQVRASVEVIDRLRTTYITWGVTRWPVDLKKLPGIFGDCVRVVRRLVPDAGAVCDAVDRRLAEHRNPGEVVALSTSR